MSTGIFAPDRATEARDLVLASLVDTAGTAKLMGDYSTFLILEALVDAHEAGTVGQLAVAFEGARPACPHDNAAVAENIRRRVAAVLAVDEREGRS